MPVARPSARLSADAPGNLRVMFSPTARAPLTSFLSRLTKAPETRRLARILSAKVCQGFGNEGSRPCVLRSMREQAPRRHRSHAGPFADAGRLRKFRAIGDVHAVTF